MKVTLVWLLELFVTNGRVNKMTNRTIKKVESEYIEETDSEGVRRIRVVTETTTWFGDNVLARHNPTKSTSVEYL